VRSDIGRIVDVHGFPSKSTRRFDHRRRIVEQQRRFGLRPDPAIDLFEEGAVRFGHA
jgi:hypothetical protein